MGAAFSELPNCPAAKEPVQLSGMIVTPIHHTRLCCSSSKYHEYVFVTAPCLAGASTPQSIYLFPTGP